MNHRHLPHGLVLLALVALAGCHAEAEAPAEPAPQPAAPAPTPAPAEPEQPEEPRRYSLTVLEAMASADDPDTLVTRGMDLGETGTVVGYARWPGYELERAVIWRAPDYRIQELPVPSTRASAAYGVNRHDQVAGAYYPPATDPGAGRPRAVLWSADAAFQDLPDLGQGASALAINADGIAVGRAPRADGGEHAVRWPAAGLLIDDLGAVSGASYADDINAAGWITGTSGVPAEHCGVDPCWRAFVLGPGDGFRTLEPLTATHSFGRALNDAGAAAGSESGGGGLRALAWRADGTPRPLPLPATAARSDALDLNSQGDVVGWYYEDGGGGGAFLVEKDEFIELSQRLTATAAGWQLSLAQAINDQGQILAVGSHPERVGRYSVLLTPEGR